MPEKSKEHLWTLLFRPAPDLASSDDTLVALCHLHGLQSDQKLNVSWMVVDSWTMMMMMGLWWISRPLNVNARHGGKNTRANWNGGALRS